MPSSNTDNKKNKKGQDRNIRDKDRKNKDNKSREDKNEKDQLSILTDTALRRIYHQEGFRFSQKESDTVQKKLSDWILKTGWISSQYAKHVGRKSVSQQDVGRALSIQGIESVSELKKYRSQLGGSKVCNTGNNVINNICEHPVAPPFGVVGDRDTSTTTCYGGGLRNKQSRKKNVHKRGRGKLSKINRKNKISQVKRGLHGGDPAYAIKHVQFNASSPANKPFCKHESDNHTFNLVNRSSFPLYKYDNLFDLDGVAVVQSGGDGAFKQLHQTTTPANMISKTLKSLGVSRWSKDATDLLHQAAEHRLRNIIHQIRK